MPGQPIKIDDEDMWASNVLQSSINELQQELNRRKAAWASYMKLLEAKYNAVFDTKLGMLLKKDG